MKHNIKLIFLAWFFFILFQPIRFVAFVIGAAVTTAKVGYFEAKIIIRDKVIS